MPALARRMVHDIKDQYPGLATHAYKQRSTAIRLFCLECMGNNRAEVTRCGSSCCPLWPFRMGGRGKPQRPPDMCPCGQDGS